MDRIPNSFFLGDNRIRIMQTSELQNAGVLGIYKADMNLIKLQSANELLSLDRVELTFYHELVHSILEHAKYNELNEDEVFVDRFALLLKQAINTMEFDNGK